jgi:hypothetical protein
MQVMITLIGEPVACFSFVEANLDSEAGLKLSYPPIGQCRECLGLT